MDYQAKPKLPEMPEHPPVQKQFDPVLEDHVHESENTPTYTALELQESPFKPFAF